MSFFTDISSGMLYPIIPIFLTTVLMAPMSVVGLIEGIAESTASILKVISGWLSDRIGKRKPFMLFGYALLSIAKPLLAFAVTWHLVLAARFLDRFGKGMRSSARDALIADSTEAKFRGKAFGLHRTLDTMGSGIGLLLALLLLFYLDGDFRSIFLVAFIPALISVIILFFLVSEKANRKGDSFKLRTSEVGRELKIFLIISMVFAIGNSSDAFLLLRAKNIYETSGGIPSILSSIFGPMDAVAVVLLVYAVYNLTYSLASTPAGAISDMIGRRNVLVAGFLTFSAVYLGFGLVEQGYLVWMLFAVYGLYIAMTDGVSKAFIVDMVPAEKRGMAIGLYYTVMGILPLLSSVIAGVMWELMGASAPFLFGSATAFIAAVLMIIALPKRSL